ncbi:MAG: outer membrane lipoprotein carrier protein LolA [Haloarculaceae archaeon]
MVSGRFRPSALSAIVVATVLLAGCSAAIGPLGDTAERQIAQQVEQRVARIDGFTATRTTTMTFDNRTRTTTAKVWVRPHSGEMRIRILTPESRAGDVTVVGTNTSWYYDASENTVTRMNFSAMRNDSTRLGARIETLFEQRNVVYAGETTLDGRTVRKVRLLPTNDTESGFATGNITMWVDTGKRFPVKIRYVLGGEMNVTTTIRYENLTINPGIDDSRFTFDPPANATVKTPSFDMETYDSRRKLADATALPVPEPTVPDGFRFDRGVVLDGTVTLRYTNGSASLLVTVNENASTASTDRGETVSVGDHEGRLVSRGPFTSVHWTCGDTGLSVSGELGREATSDVARSIYCP